MCSDLNLGLWVPTMIKRRKVDTIEFVLWIKETRSQRSSHFVAPTWAVSSRHPTVLCWPVSGHFPGRRGSTLLRSRRGGLQHTGTGTGTCQGTRREHRTTGTMGLPTSLVLRPRETVRTQGSRQLVEAKEEKGVPGLGPGMSRRSLIITYVFTYLPCNICEI